MLLSASQNTVPPTEAELSANVTLVTELVLSTSPVMNRADPRDAWLEQRCIYAAGGTKANSGEFIIATPPPFNEAELSIMYTWPVMVPREPPDRLRAPPVPLAVLPVNVLFVINSLFVAIATSPPPFTVAKLPSTTDSCSVIWLSSSIRIAPPSPIDASLALKTDVCTVTTLLMLRNNAPPTPALFAVNIELVTATSLPEVSIPSPLSLLKRSAPPRP